MKRKMKNKKGFTLVELLAVIVILGVLLLIAVPSITNVIENSRKSSYESSVKMMIENVETMASLATNTGSCYVDIADIDLDRGVKEGAGYIVYNSGTRKGTAYTYNDSRSYFVKGGTMITLTANEYKDSNNDNTIGSYEVKIEADVAAHCEDNTYSTESACLAADKTWIAATSKILVQEDGATTSTIDNLVKCPWY